MDEVQNKESIVPPTKAFTEEIFILRCDANLCTVYQINKVYLSCHHSLLSNTFFVSIYRKGVQKLHEPYASAIKMIIFS